MVFSASWTFRLTLGFSSVRVTNLTLKSALSVTATWVFCGLFMLLQIGMGRLWGRERRKVPFLSSVCLGSLCFTGSRSHGHRVLRFSVLVQVFLNPFRLYRLKSRGPIVWRLVVWLWARNCPVVSIVFRLLFLQCRLMSLGQPLKTESSFSFWIFSYSYDLKWLFCVAGPSFLFWISSTIHRSIFSSFSSSPFSPTANWLASVRSNLRSSHLTSHYLYLACEGHARLTTFCYFSFHLTLVLPRFSTRIRLTRAN